MEFKHTLEVLHSQAREIGNIMSKLEQSSDLSLIELDLLLEKLRNIYDLTIDLRTAIQSDHTVKSKTSSAEPAQTVEKQVKAEMVTEKKSVSPSKEVISEKVEKNLASMEKSKVKPKSEERFVSDRFKDSKTTLHDELSERSKREDISSQYKSRPIGKISSALGLNEKFELVNQLFDGDKEAFENTLEVLDKADSFVEAYNYLEEHFNWNMDDLLVQRILELIRRKLIVRRDDQ
jgi:hypothetical protein